ncbi:CES2-like protein [Mya arenaria]|uniref:CES2-like protein n=2 Tax=Mya arenaria TaxID=6604 RepID=A0ABY7FF41_MYAAR|nr:CES2-like protein [Mya arenaria]
MIIMNSSKGPYLGISGCNLIRNFKSVQIDVYYDESRQAPVMIAKKMTEAALDLSAKSSLGSTKSDKDSFSLNYAPESPPSPRTPLRHTSGADDNESDSSSAPTSAIKAVLGPVPSSLRDSPCSVADGEKQDSLPSSPSTPISRPFSSYAMESMASMFSSQSSLLAASHSQMPMGMGLSSLYDSSSAFPAFPVTPLTSHLLQRKRRAESRASVSSINDNSDGEGKKLKHVPDENKDESYWERRRKNNEAAKRSRDSRRHKEEEIAMRAAFLEQENLKLRAQVAILKNETAKLHYMLYNRI